MYPFARGVLAPAFHQTIGAKHRAGWRVGPQHILRVVDTGAGERLLGIVNRQDRMAAYEREVTSAGR